MIVRTHYATDNTHQIDQSTHTDDEFPGMGDWFHWADNPAVRISIDRLDGTCVVFTWVRD